MVAAFAVAIGGAFASNQKAFTDSYRSDGCVTANKPLVCTSADANDPTCTIGGFTYYRDSGCNLEWHIPQP